MASISPPVLHGAQQGAERHRCQRDVQHVDEDPEENEDTAETVNSPKSSARNRSEGE